MKNNPLVSFCILSYNQKDYISEAVLSALKQDYTNLEIIISDDNSSDGTFSIIERTIENYSTNHTIILNRNITNLGLIDHLNYVLDNYVHGEYVLLMGGDDISTVDRTSVTMDYFNKYPKIGGAVFSYNIINSSGEFLKTRQSDKDRIYSMSSFIWRSSSSFVIGGLALAFKKTIYDYFGPLENCHTEDSTIRFRIFLSSEFLYSKRICLQYRRHDSNLTSSDNLYSLKTINISNQYYKDLTIAYQQGCISEKQYDLNVNKIEWYKAIRDLLEKSHFSKFLLQKMLYHLNIKLIDCVYFLRSIFIQIG